MIIDIIFLVLMVMAFIKGYQRGLIIAIFSIVAFIIGIAAALKLSTIVASYLQSNTSISAKWLPALSFAIVFIAVVLLIKWGAKLIEKLVQNIMLGWVNRVGGIILYALLYAIILSVVFFYVNKLGIISQATFNDSVSYKIIQPLAPKAIEGLGVVVPWFKNMFLELENYFGAVANKVVS